MQDKLERSFSFTLKGNRLVQATVSSEDFRDQDAESIFQVLKAQLAFVPFSEYLKRYVYQTAGMFGSYLQISPEEYAETIIDAFVETGTPVSFRPSATRLKGRVKSWLQQAAVRRETVLLLGFALSMPEKDVNDFLTNALHDHRLDEEDPLEAMCGYCYRHGYKYAKLKQLMDIWQASEPGSLNPDLILRNQPVGREASRIIIEEDTALLQRLVERKGYPGATEQKARTERHFTRLYDQARDLIRSSCGCNDPADTDTSGSRKLEEVLCASVPRDHHGNLVPELKSDLRETIAGKRFSRQHLYELRHGIVEPSRYDLMTLRFLICAESREQEADPKVRCAQFVEDMNRILLDCGFGELYTADPYECYLLMCLLSLDPLGTYTDVQELAYCRPEAGADPIPASGKPANASGEGRHG